MSSSVRATETANVARGDFRQDATKQVITMLEKGIAPWQKAWGPGALASPNDATTGAKIRGAAALVLMAEAAERGHVDPRWLTSEQARNHGWQIRPGESSAKVELWSPSPPAAPERSGMSHAQPHGREEVAYRVYSVYNAAQVDGVPPYEPRTVSQGQMVIAAAKIVRASGADITHESRKTAFYDRNNDHIHMPLREQFRDETRYYDALLRQVGHWTGHASRLNRATLYSATPVGDPSSAAEALRAGMRATLYGATRVGDPSAAEALRAELTGVLLAAQRGIPHEPARPSVYVGAWIDSFRRDKHEFFRAAKEAQQVTSYLLALERGLTPEQARAAVIPPPLPPAVLRAVNEQATPSAPPIPPAARQAAQSLVGKDTVIEAAPTERGSHRGKIVGRVEGFVVQETAPEQALLHPLKSFEKEPETGSLVRITYAEGRAHVLELGLSRGTFRGR